MCGADGCTAPVRARGYCARHYARWRRYGDPLHVPKHRAGPRPGPRPYRWVEDRPGPTVDYSRAHAAVRRARGAASDHECECGAQAYAWAYVYAAGELHYALAYSWDPARYAPMCRACHARYDADHRRGQGYRRDTPSTD